MAKLAKSMEKISASVVEGYEKIENGVVNGFEKVTDKCVDVLFAREGETVDQDRARLSGKAEKTDE